ncbi:cytochrome P450 [Sorangium sp. So ce1128]
MSASRNVDTASEWTIGTAPGSFPWISHTWNMLRRPLSFLTSRTGARHIVKIRFGREWAYLVRHPELLRQLMVTDAAVFDKGGPIIDRMRGLVGDGIATCSHEAHRRQRRLMQPAFSRDRLADHYAPIMREEASRTADSWRSGQTVDVYDEMNALSLSIFVRTLCVIEAVAEGAAEMRQLLALVLEGIYQRMVAPVELMYRLPLPSNRRFNRAITRLRTIVNQIIDQYRRTGVDHGDLLSILLAARDEDTGECMSNREICDQVMTLMIAGIESTSATLSWAFHMLGQHPEIERRLHAEVDDVLAGRAAGFDDLPKLSYTQRVITETLRLYPPAWLMSRWTTTEVELGGHRLAPGAAILVSPYALHRDPDLFPDPERFDPDRWLSDRAETVPRGAMIPFGAGRRKCIGDAFGMAEAVIVLSTIGGRWRLRPIAGTKIRPVPMMTLNPGAVPMRVEAHYRDGVR